MNFGIIAAGEGSRLAQEGVARPKPLVELDGMPMIGRLARIFEANGADRICVITNERMTDVADYVRQLATELTCNVELVVKSTPSSMHSFWELGRLLRGHGRFVTTTVDTIFDPKLFGEYVAAYAAAPADVDGMMAVTSHIDDEKPLYVDTDGDGRITAFLDRPVEGVRFVSGGIYGLSDRALDILDDCMEQGVSRMRNYQRALVEGGLNLRAYDMGKIFDVDHSDDITKAEQWLRQR